MPPARRPRLRRRRASRPRRRGTRPSSAAGRAPRALPPSPAAPRGRAGARAVGRRPRSVSRPPTRRAASPLACHGSRSLRSFSHASPELTTGVPAPEVRRRARVDRQVSWVESQSLSFSARHESSQIDEANRVLDALEYFRDDVGGLFPRAPGEVAVVLHPRSAALTFAHPWLPLARMVAAPASRRYFAGWFSEGEIHVLAPSALERRASAVPGSREALLLSPQHEYAHIVIGANNSALPPPFSIASFRRYVNWAWLCEGAACWLAGQMPHLRAA